MKNIEILLFCKEAILDWLEWHLVGFVLACILSALFLL
jgi:hypothetical protein